MYLVAVTLDLEVARPSPPASSSSRCSHCRDALLIGHSTVATTPSRRKSRREADPPRPRAEESEVVEHGAAAMEDGSPYPCRHGHWTLGGGSDAFALQMQCYKGRLEWTALHFAAHDGLIRCVMLLLADYVPSVPLDDSASSVADGSDSQANSGSSPTSSLELKFNEPARLRYINRPADCGVTALHVAALTRHFDCINC